MTSFNKELCPTQNVNGLEKTLSKITSFVPIFKIDILEERKLN